MITTVNDLYARFCDLFYCNLGEGEFQRSLEDVRKRFNDECGGTYTEDGENWLQTIYLDDEWLYDENASYSAYE